MPKPLYQSDLSDKEWRFLRPFVPKQNPVAVPLRGADARFLYGIFYLLRTAAVGV
jgi:transposase